MNNWNQGENRGRVLLLVVGMWAAGCAGGVSAPAPQNAGGGASIAEAGAPTTAADPEQISEAGADAGVIGMPQLTDSAGDKHQAILAIRKALLLVQAVDQRDAADTFDLVLDLAFRGGDITFPDSRGTDPTLPTPLVLRPTADSIAGSASCDRDGCTFTGYVLGHGASFHRLDGTVQIGRADRGTSVKVDLVDVDLDAAGAGPATISAELEASSTKLSGSLSETTVAADNPQRVIETQSTSFQGISFELADEPGAVVPTSGSLHAEWLGGAGQGREATLSFP